MITKPRARKFRIRRAWPLTVPVTVAQGGPAMADAAMPANRPAPVARAAVVRSEGARSSAPIPLRPAPVAQKPAAPKAPARAAPPPLPSIPPDAMLFEPSGDDGFGPDPYPTAGRPALHAVPSSRHSAPRDDEWEVF